MTRRVTAHAHHGAPMPALAILTEQDWAAFAHIIALSVRSKGPRGSFSASYSISHPPTCTPRADGRCEFRDALWTQRADPRSLPRELGVYAATLEDGFPLFTYVRALTEEDWHG